MEWMDGLQLDAYGGSGSQGEGLTQAELGANHSGVRWHCQCLLLLFAQR